MLCGCSQLVGVMGPAGTDGQGGAGTDIPTTPDRLPVWDDETFVQVGSSALGLVQHRSYIACIAAPKPPFGHAMHVHAAVDCMQFVIRGDFCCLWQSLLVVD